LRDCYGNYTPRSSPAGNQVAFRRTFFEGDGLFVLEPETGSVTSAATGARFMGWSYDGRLICAPPEGYGPSGLVLYDLRTKVLRRITEEIGTGLTTPIFSDSCTWSNDSVVAFSYAQQETSRRIALFHPERGLVMQSDILGDVTTLAWLPDASGLVYGQLRRGFGEVDSLHILQRSGERVDLPFEGTWLFEVLP
jgi:hypothetical protein